VLAAVESGTPFKLRNRKPESEMRVCCKYISRLQVIFEDYIFKKTMIQYVTNQNVVISRPARSIVWDPRVSPSRVVSISGTSDHLHAAM